MYLWSLWVEKDFGAKELNNTVRGRCVNAQAFSSGNELTGWNSVVQGETIHTIVWVVLKIWGIKTPSLQLSWKILLSQTVMGTDVID